MVLPPPPLSSPPRSLPTSPRAGPAARLAPHLPRRYPARRPHRLLGSPPPIHSRPPPPPARPHRFSNFVPAARPYSPKSRRHGSLTQGLLGPTTLPFARHWPFERSWLGEIGRASCRH